MLLIFKGTLEIVFAEGQSQVKLWEKAMPNYHPSIWKVPARRFSHPDATGWWKRPVAVHIISGDIQDFLRNPCDEAFEIREYGSITCCRNVIVSV